MKLKDINFGNMISVENTAIKEVFGLNIHIKSLVHVYNATRNTQATNVPIDATLKISRVYKWMQNT